MSEPCQYCYEAPGKGKCVSDGCDTCCGCGRLIGAVFSTEAKTLLNLIAMYAGDVGGQAHILDLIRGLERAFPGARAEIDAVYPGTPERVS